MAFCPCCGRPLPDLPDLIVDPAGFLVRNGRFARLTWQEFTLFEAMRNRPGRVRSKEQLLAALYALRHDGEVPEIKIIDVFICHLRKKLAPLGLEIQTLWGHGYRFVPIATNGKKAA